MFSSGSSGSFPPFTPSLRRHEPLLGVVVCTETKPKVLVLFCGGTLIMQKNKDGALVVREKDKAIDLLLSLEPRIQEDIADLDVEFVENIDSTNMNPELWDKMGSIINEKYNDYDGFVITHGTDTMAFTASALSFSLGDLGKPVCITGGQIPGSEIASDARRNFINAVRVATLNKAGVMLVFDEDVILGARSTKVSESKLEAFGTINWGLVGELRIDARFSEDAKDRHDRPLQFLPGFEHRIVVFTLFPGFPGAHIVERVIESGNIKGIILRGYGSGNIGYDYLDAIKLAYRHKVPVVVGTQCLEGATLMHLYDVGKKALDHGVIQAYDMSIECTITKLMWALKHSDTYEELQQVMHTNFTGEINKEGKLY